MQLRKAQFIKKTQSLSVEAATLEGSLKVDINQLSVSLRSIYRKFGGPFDHNCANVKLEDLPQFEDVPLLDFSLEDFYFTWPKEVKLALKSDKLTSPSNQYSKAPSSAH